MKNAEAQGALLKGSFYYFRAFIMDTLSELKKAYEKDKPWVCRFNNIFRFVNFCKINHLTPERSRTAYDKENNCMYIEDTIKRKMYEQTEEEDPIFCD